MSPRRLARAAGGEDEAGSAIAEARFPRGAGRVFGAAAGLREEVVFFDKN
jgi:hypothetical protein